MSGPIPDDARRYVTSDEDGHLRQWVTRWLATPPEIVPFVVPATVWYAMHAFERLPLVTLLDSNGKKIDATTHITTTDVTITFSEPLSGTLILS